MIAVPKVDRADVAFGRTDFVPPSKGIPQEFRIGSDHAAVRFVEQWFFEGADAQRLKERPGVDRVAALGALRAVMVSFDLDHNHKIAGAAYLLDQWFEVTDAREAVKP
jgi:hypothetical protein